jgi:site-specific recombinase XerD
MEKAISVFELCGQLKEALIRKKQSKDSMYRYGKVLSEFCEYTGDVQFSYDLPGEFLVSVIGGNGGIVRKGEHSKKQLYYIRTMRAIEEYCCFGTFRVDGREDIPKNWPKGFEQALMEYFYQRELSGMSKQGFRDTMVQIKYFVMYLARQNANDWDSLKSCHLTGYISTMVDYAPQTISSKISFLRVMLRYMYLNGYVKEPFHENLPRVANLSRKNLPAIWEVSDVEKLKSVIDIGNPSGKRDFAIVSLAASTGLRAGDIMSLKLRDIDWARKEITVVQNKTLQTNVLPLMEDVGWAIIDYIKNGRPISDSDCLFLNHLPPFGHIIVY